MQDDITPTLARRDTARSAARHVTGATFAELMLATLILGYTVVGATNSLSKSAAVYHYFNEGAHESLMLAQEIHEAARLLPWGAAAGAPATFGPEVVTIWDLHNKTFCPPRSADYVAIVSHLSWSQKAEIDYVDLDNPTDVIDPEFFTGKVQVRLRVTILQGQQEVDSFDWWMSEPESID